MCIYYQNKDGLTYDSREHIFPAAIGGLTKLAKGLVSDQFNSKISKLEREVLHKSILSAARELEGPGKRGSLSPKYATKSEICLIENGQKRGEFGLGYVQKHKTTEISSYKFDISTGLGTFSFPDGEGLELFRERCFAVKPNRIKVLNYSELSINTMILGVALNVEPHYDYFVAKNPENKYELSVNKFKDLAERMCFSGEPQKSLYMPIVSKSIIFSDDYLRFYGKIAINALTHLRGREFINRPDFDQIKAWISEGGENHFGEYVVDQQDVLQMLNISFPESFHLVTFSSDEKGVFANVFLYKTLHVRLKLSEVWVSGMGIEGWFCDWSKKSEMNFRDYWRTNYISNSI